MAEDLTEFYESSWREAWDSTWRLYERRWFTAVSIVADLVVGVVVATVSSEQITKPEAAILGAGGAAAFAVGSLIVIGIWNVFRAPYRQRDRARRRLIAIIAVDAIALEPFPDGGPAYLRVKNQGPAGTFRVHLLMDSGREYYLGWSPDGKRDKHLLTGETGQVYVAGLRRDDKWQGGLVMAFWEADKDKATTQSSMPLSDRYTMRATVLSEHGGPASIDLVLGAKTKPASWDATLLLEEVTLERGDYEPLD